jgi:hypothetical protein
MYPGIRIHTEHLIADSDRPHGTWESFPMGLSVQVAGNTVYAQMHARVRRICGDSHELALRNVPITITITSDRPFTENMVVEVYPPGKVMRPIFSQFRPQMPFFDWKWHHSSIPSPVHPDFLNYLYIYTQ